MLTKFKAGDQVIDCANKRMGHVLVIFSDAIWCDLKDTGRSSTYAYYVNENGLLSYGNRTYATIIAQNEYDCKVRIRSIKLRQ